MRVVMSFHVHVQVCLCFRLDLPSCFSVRQCQQNASAPHCRLSPHPSPSSSSFSGPPSSRAEMPFNPGRGMSEMLPRVRCSAGWWWPWWELKLTHCARCKPGAGSRALRPLPSCVSGGRPLAVAVWQFLNWNQGVPRGLAVKPPARAAGVGASWPRGRGGPFPSGDKVIF